MLKSSKELVNFCKFLIKSGIARELVYLSQCHLKVMKICLLMQRIELLLMRMKEIISY
jgi:hypothetical protein